MSLWFLVAWVPWPVHCSDTFIFNKFTGFEYWEITTSWIWRRMLETTTLLYGCTWPRKRQDWGRVCYVQTFYPLDQMCRFMIPTSWPVNPMTLKRFSPLFLPNFILRLMSFWWRARGQHKLRSKSKKGIFGEFPAPRACWIAPCPGNFFLSTRSFLILVIATMPMVPVQWKYFFFRHGPELPHDIPYGKKFLIFGEHTSTLLGWCCQFDMPNLGDHRRWQCDLFLVTKHSAVKKTKFFCFGGGPRNFQVLFGGGPHIFFGSTTFLWKLSGFFWLGLLQKRENFKNKKISEYLTVVKMSSKNDQFEVTEL